MDHCQFFVSCTLLPLAPKSRAKIMIVLIFQSFMEGHCWHRDHTEICESARPTPRPLLSLPDPLLLYLLLSAFYSLSSHKQKIFFCVCLFAASLRCMRLHLAELMEAITSCLLLTVNGPYFGRGSNLIHNWKWLLWSIWYAFVLPTSATPGGCSWGICSFFSVLFFPSISSSPSFDAFPRWQFTLQLRLL